jgi:plasmid stability protein
MAIIHYELPDDLHRALKIRAAQESITLKALIIRYLELGLSGELVEAKEKSAGPRMIIKWCAAHDQPWDTGDCDRRDGACELVEAKEKL